MAFTFKLEHEDSRRPTRRRSTPPYRTGVPATRFRWDETGLCAS
jgi:hypothetical protein